MSIENIISKISNKKLTCFFKRRNIFPYYHIISDNDLKHLKYLYSFKNKDQFISDLDYLCSNYSAMNPNDLLNGKTCDNHFLITFDDGLIETYTEVLPILEERNIKAIFFLNPAFVDNKNALYRHLMSHVLSDLLNENNRDKIKSIARILGFSFSNQLEFAKNYMKLKFEDKEKFDAVLSFLNIDKSSFLDKNKFYLEMPHINEMIEKGHYFGGHTMTHPPLGVLNHQDQKAEILDSIKWVKEKFNLSYSFFAFPFSDQSMTEKLYREIITVFPDVILFGNSGISKDISSNIIQRFSLENPNKKAGKKVVFENLMYLYKRLRMKAKIVRK